MIVEDHAILSEVLAMALRLHGFDEVDIQTDDLAVDAVVGAAERFRPDVVLLDLFLGEAYTGIPLIAPLQEHGATVLVLTASQDPTMLAQCLEAGAAGVFSKSRPFDELVELVSDAALGITVMRPAVRDELIAEAHGIRRATQALRGPFEQLTAREQGVLLAMIDGCNAEEIAVEHVVSVATVRSHIRSILRKLGVNSQLAAVGLARRAGWSGNAAGR
jgi:DNA-binding NarL/FixJ family response regulator